MLEYWSSVNAKSRMNYVPTAYFGREDILKYPGCHFLRQMVSQHGSQDSTSKISASSTPSLPSNFYFILCLNKMAISHYQVCKPDTFESYKSLKLSFTNIQGPRSKLLVVNLSLPRINTLWGGLIERTSSILDEIASKTARIYSFFMRDRLGRLNGFRQFLCEGLFSFNWKRYCNSFMVFQFIWRRGFLLNETYEDFYLFPTGFT